LNVMDLTCLIGVGGKRNRVAGCACLLRGEQTHAGTSSRRTCTPFPAMREGASSVPIQQGSALRQRRSHSEKSRPYPPLAHLVHVFRRKRRSPEQTKDPFLDVHQKGQGGAQKRDPPAGGSREHKLGDPPWSLGADPLDPKASLAPAAREPEGI
jgi:hypothetical protein